MNPRSNPSWATSAVVHSSVPNIRGAVERCIEHFQAGGGAHTMPTAGLNCEQIACIRQLAPSTRHIKLGYIVGCVDAVLAGCDFGDVS